jgi:hypothetical protein
MKYALARILPSLLLLTTAPLAQNVAVVAQDRTTPRSRTVQFEPSLPNDLVRVVKVVLDDVEVRPGTSFRASDDWFNRIKVVIKNISPKTIVFAAGQLRFPETGDATAEHLAVMDRISIGQRPEQAGRRPNDVPSTPILVGPGQEVTIPVVDNLERTKAAIASRQPLSSVTTCAIGLTTLYFDDGTLWLSGVYFRADPSAPGRYVRTSREEFDVQRKEDPQ